MGQFELFDILQPARVLVLPAIAWSNKQGTRLSDFVARLDGGTNRHALNATVSTTQGIWRMPVLVNKIYPLRIGIPVI